ncbi:MAG: hypothetical protein DBX90_02505 [Lentisphaerae bacterium]|nr:MAG: hypothetical protein DBX90_02505 [Lentisphaerota bacterium]
MIWILLLIDPLAIRADGPRLPLQYTVLRKMPIASRRKASGTGRGRRKSADFFRKDVAAAAKMRYIVK